MAEKHTSNESGPAELAGLKVLVTGSSSGIGRAMALELAAAGADVLVHARESSGPARQVADAVREMGRASDVFLFDLADATQHEQLVDQVWARYGGVDVWINNAGADVLTGDASDGTFEEKLEQLWRVDVVSTIRLSRLVGHRMKQREDGSGRPLILNIGWDQVAHGMEGDSGEMFSAVKGAVMAFTKSLAKSLAPQVRVNCIAAGWIKTEWGHRASDYWQQRACDESLLGRWGTPEDVAHVARFLASPGAAFITGQVINVNGGFRHGSPY